MTDWGRQTVVDLRRRARFLQALAKRRRAEQAAYGRQLAAIAAARREAQLFEEKQRSTAGSLRFAGHRLREQLKTQTASNRSIEVSNLRRLIEGRAVLAIMACYAERKSSFAERQRFEADRRYGSLLQQIAGCRRALTRAERQRRAIGALAMRAAENAECE